MGIVNDVYSEIEKLYGLDKEQLENFIKDYENGVSAYKLSKKYNIETTMKVYNIVQKYNRQKGPVYRDYTEKRRIFEREEELSKLKSKYNLTPEDLKDMLEMHNQKISAFQISKKYNLNGSSEVYTILKKAKKFYGDNQDTEETISSEEIKKRMKIYTMNIQIGYDVKDISEGLNIPEKTVKKDINFIVKLRKTIEGYRRNDTPDSEIIKKFNNKGIEMTEEILKTIKGKEDKGNIDR